MDPQQRLTMTYIWKAIEDAGYSAASLAGSRTAILIGTGINGYEGLLARAGADIDGYRMTGMTSSIGPNRMSYFLNLHGPSQPIETACSRSLIAVHRAIQALSPLPLSYAQERLFLVHQQDSVGGTYNLSIAFWLGGNLNVAALQASVTEVVRRHESLRTRFAVLDGTPVQVIEPKLVVDVPVFDLQRLSDGERPVEIRRLADELMNRPFDLAVAPLFRAGVIRAGPIEHLIVIVAHHIVSDGWSQEILIQELGALYSAFSQGLPSPLPDLAIQYADYAIWQKEQVQGNALDRERAYWIARVLDAPDLKLPTDRPRPEVKLSRIHDDVWFPGT